MKKISTLIITLLIAHIMIANPVITATTTNGAWSHASTWNLNRVPADNDTIVIPANITVKMKNPRSLDNVIIVVSGTLLLDGGKLNLNNSSRIILEPGGTVSGLSHSEHITIGSVVKFYGDETAVTSLSYADSTTGVSPNGFRQAGSLLPVIFMNFYARRSAKDILLSWATAQEINNDHFEIERSADGRQWNVIAFVFGAGSSNTVNAYSYADKNITQAVVYYRIRQVDGNGHTQYSAVKAVRSNETVQAANIYVAAKQTVAIDFSGDTKDNIVVKVIDMKGQLIAQQAYPQAANRVTLQVNSTVAGIYVVQVKDGNGWQEVKKITL